MRTRKPKLFYLAINLFLVELYTRILDISTRVELLIVAPTRKNTQTKSDYVSVTGNPHVDTHSDVGAVTQMDLSKKEG